MARGCVRRPVRRHPSKVGWVRAAFAVGALLGGLGIALYLACWLIIPAQGAGEERQGRPASWSAQACAACAALLALAAIGAVATVFGFGWVVVGVAAVCWRGARRPAGWARPGRCSRGRADAAALAVAADGLRLTTQPRRHGGAGRRRAIEGRVYRSGLNTMLVDLRHTRCRQRDGDAAHRRRRAAHDRRAAVAACVRVASTTRSTRSCSGWRAAQRTAGSSPTWSCSAASTAGPAVTSRRRHAPGPVLDVDFSSQGGSLYVRDYPDAVTPPSGPTGPGSGCASSRARTCAGRQEGRRAPGAQLAGPRGGPGGQRARRQRLCRDLRPAADASARRAGRPPAITPRSTARPARPRARPGRREAAVSVAEPVTAPAAARWTAAGGHRRAAARPCWPAPRWCSRAGSRARWRWPSPCSASVAAALLCPPGCGRSPALRACC